MHANDAWLHDCGSMRFELVPTDLEAKSEILAFKPSACGFAAAFLGAGFGPSLGKGTGIPRRLAYSSHVTTGLYEAPRHEDSLHNSTSCGM